MMTGSPRPPAFTRGRQIEQRARRATQRPDAPKKAHGDEDGEADAGADEAEEGRLAEQKLPMRACRSRGWPRQLDWRPQVRMHLWKLVEVVAVAAPVTLCAARGK